MAIVENPASIGLRPVIVVPGDVRDVATQVRWSNRTPRRELTKHTPLAEHISYRVASATDLPFEDGAFAQVWMLDVGIHRRDKSALFGEIGRVLRPAGLLVMHDQMGPLPKAMAPATRNAPSSRRRCRS
jgi:SAM-dependent methyltransferase